VLIQKSAISNGVRDDQEDDVDLAVSLLERQPPLNRLRIAQPRLALASRSTSPQDDEAVPRSPISSDRERDFRPPQRL